MITFYREEVRDIQTCVPGLPKGVIEFPYIRKLGLGISLGWVRPFLTTLRAVVPEKRASQPVTTVRQPSNPHVCSWARNSS